MRESAVVAQVANQKGVTPMALIQAISNPAPNGQPNEDIDRIIDPGFETPYNSECIPNWWTCFGVCSELCGTREISA